MPLVKCHECGKDVSTEAKTCPSCGAKVKKPTSRAVKLIGVAFVVAVIGTAITGNNALQTQQSAESTRRAALSPEQRATEDAAKAKRDIELQTAAAGAIRLKNAMKDPAAFELTSLVVKPDGAACYEYRAKNSYGATFPSAAVLTTKGKMLLKEHDGNTFVNAWNKACTPPGGDEIASFVTSRVLK